MPASRYDTSYPVIDNSELTQDEQSFFPQMKQKRFYVSSRQGPQKAITAAIEAPSSNVTFIIGTADGCMLSFATEYRYIGGNAHASLVAGLSVSSSDTVRSVSFDDRLREIDGKAYTPASGDSTVFVVEVENVEAVRVNQKVAIAASGLLVTIGGEAPQVQEYHHPCALHLSPSPSLPRSSLCSYSPHPQPLLVLCLPRYQQRGMGMVR
ncbi:hypothetical protein BD310DRAFT_947030 [Dichomitus squalens]|uniref:Uncharacterized protein n=1 Tax=Dichomitus squalens TaxID=114155 RepID=A0A4Q9Q1S2_9APHY|nr:hypothetical protein BD310DRAFT_947030 [Dichomitus squalens]